MTRPTPKPGLRSAVIGTLLAVLLLTLSVPAPAIAQPEPDAPCTTTPADPTVACPDDPEITTLIDWVKSVPEGVSIHLTEAGVALGRSCHGAGELVGHASDLYAALPAESRSHDDLLWANPALTREVFAHSWAATLGSDRGNPVDVVFSDYAGDPGSLQSRIYRGPALAMVC